MYVLLYDSWRHTNSLQNGYEIFLVKRSGRERIEKDFLMTVKNNEECLLGKKNISVELSYSCFERAASLRWNVFSGHLLVRSEQSGSLERMPSVSKNMILLTLM